jgi:hypothetical protein
MITTIPGAAIDTSGDLVLSSNEPVGKPHFDLPLHVEMLEPFKVDVWIEALDPSFVGAARIYMEQTDTVAYYPRVFSIKLGERKTIEARVLKSHSGLAEISASGDGWGPAAAAIDAGFTGKLRSDIGESIEGGSQKDFRLSLVDVHEKPIRLDVPVRATIQASNALIRLGLEAPWSNAIEVDFPRGASSAPPIEITSESFTRKVATVTATLKINHSYPILSESFQFMVSPRWWMLLLMSVLGGLLHCFYETSKELLRTGANKQSGLRKIVARATIAAISGTVGYLLASANLVGIKVDTTSLWGFIILGFLFSCAGIDVVLKRGLGGATYHPSKP